MFSIVVANTPHSFTTASSKGQYVIHHLPPRHPASHLLSMDCAIKTLYSEVRKNLDARNWQ